MSDFFLDDLLLQLRNQSLLGPCAKVELHLSCKNLSDCVGELNLRFGEKFVESNLKLKLSLS